MASRRPASRRGRYGHSQPPRISVGKALVAAGVFAAVAALVVAGLWLGKYHFRLASQSGPVPNSAPAAAQLVYTERTANDAAVTLPATVQSQLHQIGLKHQSIQVTRIGFTGHTFTSRIDMTPRAGNSSTGPTALVGIGQILDTKIATVQGTINSSPAGVPGGRALFAGLTKIDFTGAPVTIISSGLDLANPDNFRALKWSVPPAELVAGLKNAHDLPALHGPVTFVLVPTAGSQPQLGEAQKTYLQSVWKSLLTAAGATSVRFVDGISTPARSPVPTAPIVSVPNQIGTPFPQHRVSPNKVTCTVPASRFIVNTPELADPAQTEQDLTPCIQAALKAHASFALDGWTSYEGPLNANGEPVMNYPVNIQLSQNRVRTIESLLVNDLAVPTSEITRTIGHGDFGQPYPGPSSPKNRVVIITYTVK